MAVYPGGKTAEYVRYAVIVCSIILAILVLVLVRDYWMLRGENLMNEREAFFLGFVAQHGPLGPNDVGIVRSWMTFDYVNVIFRLPPDYLRNALSISDPHYPRLSIAAYAKKNKFDQGGFLSAVEAAIGNYFSTTTQ